MAPVVQIVEVVLSPVVGLSLGLAIAAGLAYYGPLSRRVDPSALDEPTMSGEARSRCRQRMARMFAEPPTS